MPAHHTLFWMLADGDRTRPDEPFHTRDGLARDEVAAALAKDGFEAGRSLLNFPPPDREEPIEPAHIDTSWSRPRDLLGTYTRMPSADRAQRTRKRVPLGFTDLEREVMYEWEPYVPHASRLQGQIHKRLHGLLRSGYEDRARWKVYERDCAPYDELVTSDSKVNTYVGGTRTPVFLLRIPRMSKRTMGYLGIWGFDGNATLIWATLLRHRHADLLRRNHFVFAELVGGSVPARPFDLDYALEWRAEIVIDEPIRRGPRGSQRLSMPSGKSFAAA